MLSADDVVQFFQSEPVDYELDEGLLERIEATVEIGLSPTEFRIRNLKIRLALYFCPIEVFESPDENKPIYVIIAEHLQSDGRYTEQDSIRIGQEVQKILESWWSSRYNVSKYKDRLLRQQGMKCNNCNIKFDGEVISYTNSDEFKPYHHSTPENDLTEPQVDHIDPVWALGTNSYKNLQVLCKLCNQGKGGALNTSVKSEVENAGKPLSEISWKFRANMFYQATKNVDKCPECGSEGVELTVRKQYVNGCYTKSNLSPLCVDCAYSPA